MPEVTCTTEIPASAYTVWSVVRNFNGLAHWMEAVVSCTSDGTGVGTNRTLTLADGGVIVEKLETCDETARSMSYSIVSGPLPVANYLATMTVTELADALCEVEWSGTCESAGASDEEVDGILNGIYSGGLEDLRRRYVE